MNKQDKFKNEMNLQTATFAGGCFWCTEALFRRLQGVQSVTSGYAGGIRENPSYEQVLNGATGHAEAVQIQFDPNIISYEKLLEIFFHIHDPTTLNQQGADVGTQYRSAIFYHNEEQRLQAEKIIESISRSGIYDNPIVTEIIPYAHFYEAEEDHREYYDNNPSLPYCRIVIEPKLRKLLNAYSGNIK